MCCSEELDEDAQDYQRRDHLREGEEGADDCGGAEVQERDVGEAAGRVELAEDGEEVAVAGGGEGDARVAEEQREDAGEGGDHDEHGGDLAEEQAGGGAE